MKLELAQSTQKSPTNVDHNFTVLLAGRNRTGLDQLVDIVSRIKGINITTNHICNVHSDPLHGVDTLPQLLVFWLGENWRDELSELVQRSAKQRPAIIVVANTSEQEAMRMAMKAGAIDYIRSPFDALELQRTICKQIEEKNFQGINIASPITSFINAKGGSGCSLIACNSAHMMAEITHSRVALIDLDLQFGSLCHYLDMEPTYGLMEALENVYELDKQALEAYMLKHSSGLHLLDIKPGDLFVPEDISTENMDILLQLLATNYDHVVVDLPRHISMLSSMVLEKSEKVVVVMQQSISHLRDAKRLLHILKNDIGIEENKIRVVVNRYNKNDNLNIDDIGKALRHSVNLTAPNSYAQVSESINQGVPLYDISKKSPLTQSMMNVGYDISGGVCIPQQISLISRLLKHIRGV